ncbi:hypothetical protein LOZ53_006637 [Ophidiomyces ophidiicola]|nr:hypothetical protein LOZ55_005710 [Ophidiomyces ophidiicola]KAI1976272.1 hypothetical protein LOZ54_006635 [Ophidiomyces ophidiicola]KAI1980508.1 hypothetical protein LOZ53_006637 [Ophidiomyces ophidiicola]KAI2001130.1 hypothetical protein LOZ51_001422 [Ophidiomyces ophidiicola]
MTAAVAAAVDRRPFDVLHSPDEPDPRFLSGGHPEAPRRVNSRHSARSQRCASQPPPSSAADAASADPDVDLAEELAWGPAHPCYPHLNPHVAVQSAAYAQTRIIRIRRDWMIKGDLAPTFSNLYPEILDPLLPEPEFRKLIARINDEIVAAYSPFGLRNWLDAALGFLTGWLWDDLGLTRVKARLRALEAWIVRWNTEVGAAEGVKIWPLRSTGYTSLDIQIPDPKVGIVGSENASLRNMVVDAHGARMDESSHVVRVTSPEN